MAKSFPSKKKALLGDFQFKEKHFANLDSVFLQFEERSFQVCNAHEKSNWISRVLLELIQKEEGESFLLEAVIDFIVRINQKKILLHYTFSTFELWLNHFSGLNEENNYKLRAKIMGKKVPRDAYQIYFPIGMGKSYPGTHFVTAHYSPDLDSTIASFWGWVDAFAARIGRGLHIWNVPGGPPFTQVETDLLFTKLFGEGIFDCLAKTGLSLTLTSLDLMTQEGLTKKHTHELSLSFDYARERSAVVLISDEGYYIGDWRATDVEGVRQIVMALNNCLMWIEATIHIKLISCLAKPIVTIEKVTKIINEILALKLGDASPAKEFSFTLKKFVHQYLIKVLQVSSGMEATFEEFSLAIEKFGIALFSETILRLKTLPSSNLFDERGVLKEDRPLIFSRLEVFVKMVADAFAEIRKYMDRLEIAFKIKTDVFGFSIPLYLTQRTEIEEIRSKMRSYSYLTVNHVDEEGRHIPIGIVRASSLQSKSLGTVSLRDFCNREEMKIPPYLDIISIIDHHKSSLLTHTPPTAMISDAQSSNALVAQMAFSINDQYSCGGINDKDVYRQMQHIEKDLSSLQNIRIYQRLLQKRKALQTKGTYFIHPKRETIEYLHFLYAILDDTDLLTKVSRIDVECMASLLNRLKSLMFQEEVEIVHFDDIREDRDFTRKAAERLLQNEDFYSLYSKVYLHRESGVDENLDACIQGLPSNIFSDIKILNGCNRVGQTKIFACNYSHFAKLGPQLRDIWYKNALVYYENNREVMLHLHMISTIASADELYQGETVCYQHQDELWIWIPQTELAIGQLKLFLNAFRFLPNIHALNLNVQFLGSTAKQLSQIFKESFIPIPHYMPEEKNKEKPNPIAILRYKSGTFNSRKAMISPYLPRL